MKHKTKNKQRSAPTRVLQQRDTRLPTDNRLQSSLPQKAQTNPTKEGTTRLHQELIIAQQHIIALKEQLHAKDQLLDQLDHKITNQIEEIGELKSTLLQLQKTVQTYALHLSPLQQKVLELKQENTSIKNSVSQAEKEKRQLFLDLSNKEQLLSNGDPQMLAKFQAYQQEHEAKLKTVVEHYTKQHLFMASQIQQLKQAVYERDQLLQALGKMQQEVARRLLH